MNIEWLVREQVLQLKQVDDLPKKNCDSDFIYVLANTIFSRQCVKYCRIFMMYSVKKKKKIRFPNLMECLWVIWLSVLNILMDFVMFV